MRKIKNIQSNNQSIKRFLSPQPPVIQYKKRRKVTTDADENRISRGNNNVDGLASQKLEICGDRNKNNDPCVSNNFNDALAQNSINADVSVTMQEKNLDWNSFVSDPAQICETRYPITLNTFKTMTHCGIVVQRILEDMKTATGLDFLNDEIIKERVLRNYYKQFYEQPQIRERYKLDIKACPTFVKKKIMQTPELMGSENDVSNNNDRSASLEPDAARELVSTQKVPESVAKQINHPNVNPVSQQIAGTQTKRHPNILRLSNRAILSDSAFLLRHIKRHVSDSNKQQTILERIKSEVLHPVQCTQSIETNTKNMPEKNVTDVEHSVISLSSSSESIVINSVKQRLQEVQDLYFKEYVKTNTLPYALRMSKGLKRQIITTILKITFEEFSKYTHIYKGAEIYEDLELLGGYYDYAIKEPKIWPINLFMTVRDLCEFLKSKSIILTTANLKDIPPILLHWEELTALTNFDKIVRWDYYRCKGEKLNKEDTQLMSAYRKKFYEKCWHQNQWLRNVPQFLYMQGMLCIPVMNDQRQCIESTINNEQSLREEKVVAEDEDGINVVAEVNKAGVTLTQVESIPNSSIQDARNTSVREQADEVGNDCEMSDVGLEQVSVAVDNDEKSQESVVIVDQLPPKCSLTTVTSLTAIDSIQIDDMNVTDNAVQQRLKKAQNLYFKDVAKSCTLPYLLRLHTGLKRRVIAAVANMTFTEFQKYTNIYGGAEIYKDLELLQRCYNYACKEPQVWPINLYIRLTDLFRFLETKGVSLTISDLKYVSPKFLHWYDLIATTNYDYIVYWDYYRNSGNKFNRVSTSIDSYCQTFYAKCWHEDKWIWHTPRILPDVPQDLGVSKFEAEADNENIIFERAVITYSLRRQQEVEINERIETAVMDSETHTVAVDDAEMQTAQDIQEDAPEQEIGTSGSKSREAPEQSGRQKTATVDAEIQTSQNLIGPALSSADPQDPSDMQSSKPCLTLPSRDIKEEKLTPLNKLQFNLTVDDGDNYECVQAPDDVIELDTTLALSQSPQDIILPLSNSENLDANNFNILLSEVHDLRNPQIINEEQQTEARSEQEVSELISQGNALQREEQMRDEVNESQANQIKLPEVAEQPLSKQSQDPLEQQEQLLQVEAPLAKLTLECEEESNAQQQHEDTSLEDYMPALVEQVSQELETEQEMVVTKSQQEKQQPIQLHQNQYELQEQEVQSQLKILEKQQQELQLQIKQYQERELQLQLQQEKFEKLQLQIKQEVKKSQPSPMEHQKQTVQQQHESASKQNQKRAARNSENRERIQKPPRAEQKTQTQQNKSKSISKPQQSLTSEHKQSQQTTLKQEPPAEQLVRQHLRQTGQQTTSMEQQDLVLEQLVAIAVQESPLIEEQPQQQPRAAIEQSTHVYVQQNDEDPQEEDQQQVEEQFEEPIEEITIANHSQELKVLEQPNVRIESTSENLCIDDRTNTEFDAHELLQQLTSTQELHKTAEQQYSATAPQQNSTLQTPQIILQRTRTHVQEQFMIGPTIASTQDVTTINRPQARVSKQQMRTTETTTLTKTKTKTVRGAKTTTATAKPLPVALNNQKMSPVASTPAPTTANIMTLPSTCDPFSNNPIQINNQLVPVTNDQTLMSKTATPNTPVLLTLPSAAPMASTNSISTNNSSYGYGLSGDNTFFNSSQLLQILEQYQLQNQQTSLQQHDLQPIQQQHMQLLQQPQANYEHQALEQQQPQQQLQLFQHSSIQQFHQMLPPPLVPIQTNNVVPKQQQFLPEEPKSQHEQLLQPCEQQTPEQHPPYAAQQHQHQLQFQQQQHYIQQEHHIQQPHYPLHTTTHQPIVYQLLDVTQAPQPQNSTVQQHLQKLEYLQQQTRKEQNTQLKDEIGIGLEDGHIVPNKDEVEHQEILDALNSKHLQELSLQQAKYQFNSTIEMLWANIRIEHNYTKLAPASSLLTKLLDAPKLSSPTKGNASSRMRPNVRLKPFLFRQIEAFDFFNQITTLNIADYQLQCTNIGQPYLQAKIRTSQGRNLVVFGGDMLKSLLPRCTPTLEQDVSAVLQYLDEFHYNKWEQRQQRNLISKCTHRTLHTLCAQTLLIYFEFSSPFQIQNDWLNLKHDAPKFEQPNRLSAAATRTASTASLRPVDSLDDLSMAIEPSILEQMAALRCHF